MKKYLANFFPSNTRALPNLQKKATTFLTNVEKWRQRRRRRRRETLTYTYTSLARSHLYTYIQFTLFNPAEHEHIIWNWFVLVSWFLHRIKHTSLFFSPLLSIVIFVFSSFSLFASREREKNMFFSGVFIYTRITFNIYLLFQFNSIHLYTTKHTTWKWMLINFYCVLNFIYFYLTKQRGPTKKKQHIILHKVFALSLRHNSYAREPPISIRTRK